MEDSILEMMSFLEGVDFIIVFQAFGVGLFIFWLVIIGWAAIDASERLESKWLRLLAIVLVVALPLFGLLIYLTVRPRETREESKWTGAERRYLKFETSGLYDCPLCSYEVFPNYIFCPNCGNELRFKCEGCDVYLEPEWNTCPYCGKNKSNASQRQSRGKSGHPHSDERRDRTAVDVRPPRKEETDSDLEKIAKSEIPEKEKPDHDTVTRKEHRGEKPKKEETEKEETPQERKPAPKRKEPALAKVTAELKLFMKKVDDIVKRIGAVPLGAVKTQKPDSKEKEKNKEGSIETEEREHNEKEERKK